MNKQIINLVGGLASALILIAGVVLFAVPLFLQAESTGKEADAVKQSNLTQQSVIDALRVQQADSATLEAETAALRAKIPAESRMDDIARLALSAASAHGGTVESVSPGDAEPFAARDGASAEQPAAASIEVAEEPTADATAADATAADAGGADATADAAPADAAALTRTQLPVQLVFSAPGVEAATAMVDALRDGPRVVAITHSTVTSDTSGDTERVTLTVTLLAFADES